VNTETPTRRPPTWSRIAPALVGAAIVLYGGGGVAAGVMGGPSTRVSSPGERIFAVLLGLALVALGAGVVRMKASALLVSCALVLALVVVPVGFAGWRIFWIEEIGAPRYSFIALLAGSAIYVGSVGVALWKRT
jgi:hypothetical protein